MASEAAMSTRPVPIGPAPSKGSGTVSVFAYLLMFTAGSAVNAGVSLTYKFITPDLSSVEIIAARSVLIALVVFLAMPLFLNMTAAGAIRNFTIRYPLLHLLRGLATFGTWFGVVYAIRSLTLAEAQTLIFTDALFAPLAFALFGDRKKGSADPLVISITFIGFTGILAICVPQMIDSGRVSDDLGGWIAALGAGFLFACTHVIAYRMKSLPNGDGQRGPMMLTSAVVAAVLAFAWIFLEPPAAIAGGGASGDGQSGQSTSLFAAFGMIAGWGDVWLLLLSSILSTLASWLMLKGSVGGAYATPGGLICLPLSYVLGVFLVGERLTANIVIGGAIVMLALAGLVAADIVRTGRRSACPVSPVDRRS